MKRIKDTRRSRIPKPVGFGVHRVANENTGARLGVNFKACGVQRRGNQFHAGGIGMVIC